MALIEIGIEIRLQEEPVSARSDSNGGHPSQTQLSL
jgi:hypothetical protein